ncbi:GAF and ANTAR domain-containing protein [Pseudonocardia sp. MH-G8]|uniref:GAF and ANTAR domain-containing protein n=1 Tax=Pseudonocardia sp. MH-G8 TaxID=1854588 RepID=UPI000BA079E4|nr:GAF and ANTAR domain-containing protein [Pseudonocardia sp. MH-G8]OZM82019.1 antitermination regulator [Pseudonocardia sp. MH-G8]
MTDDADDVASKLAEMARVLLGERTVQATLDTIVEWAVQTVDGCDHAGILTIDRRGNVLSAAATDDVVRQSDAVQGELREGPCYDALREGRTFEIPDMAGETRWQRYAPRAVQLGIGSGFGFQLSTGGDTLGALNLYAKASHAFGEQARQVGTVFAAQAAVAMAWSRTEAQLREAISSRQVIGEAIGILMERRRLTSAQAFALLTSASQQSNIKLREIAERVAQTGEEPAQ